MNQQLTKLELTPEEVMELRNGLDFILDGLSTDDEVEERTKLYQSILNKLN